MSHETASLSESEAAKVAAFGLDKEPDLAELMATAAAKMLNGADQVKTAMEKFTTRAVVHPDVNGGE